MKDKVVMVTGATSGIGKVAATALASQGAHVAIVSRSEEKCQQVAKQIREHTNNSNVAYFVGDLSSLAEVRRVAQEFLAKYDRLDVLLNNAGAMFEQRRESIDGYEMTLALNHLNYFLLTHELLDLLKQTAETYGEARIVNVSSGAHEGAKPQSLLDDPQMKKKYSGIVRYCETKLANIMFTYELARRLKQTKVTVNTLHPGFVATHFGHEMKGWWTGLFKFVQRWFALSEERGAETSIYLATSPEMAGVTGKYFIKKRERKTTKGSYDEAAQKQLWRLSEELTGIA